MYAIDQAEMSMSGKVITGINGHRFSTRNMREQAGVQNTRIVIRTTFKMYMTNTAGTWSTFAGITTAIPINID